MEHGAGALIEVEVRCGFGFRFGRIVGGRLVEVEAVIGVGAGTAFRHRANGSRCTKGAPGPMLETQHAWFSRVVAENPVTFIDAWTDRPSYNGSTGNADHPLTNRTIWSPLFNEPGVDLALSGHLHPRLRGESSAASTAHLGQPRRTLMDVAQPPARKLPISAAAAPPTLRQGASLPAHGAIAPSTTTG
jgi:hypothetical protein